MSRQQHNLIKEKYTSLYGRVARAIQTGRFMQYTRSKRVALKNRLERYERRLKQWGVAVASAAALFGMPMTAQGQLAFTQKTGADNPLNSFYLGINYTVPVFVDIDGDGDMDMVVGMGYYGYGRLDYYENTGTAQSPTFTQRTNAANPFNGLVAGYYSSPTFVDMDGDGDMDLISGNTYGTFIYFENTGNASTPAFTLRTGAANPLDGKDVGFASAPTFVDIDGDGDMDMFSGSSNAGLKFYENTGNASSPVFTERTGVDNPFDNSTYVMSSSEPDFLDIDGDGDMDLVVGVDAGSSTGVFRLFQNTGTTSVPAFAELTGANNPFDGVVLSSKIAPDFVDIDGDGKEDMFSGDGHYIRYFKNESVPASTPITFVERTGSGANPNPFDGFDVGMRSAPTFVDLDGDGDQDMVSGEFDGFFNYFRNDAGTFTEQTGANNPLDGFDVGWNSHPTFGDLDGDGDLDMVSGFSFGGFKYYRNDAGTFTEQTGANNPLDGFDVGTHSSPILVDFDGDGDLDLIVGESDGFFNYFRNDAGTFTEQTGANNPFNGFDVGQYSTPAFVNFDGDGDLDMISGGSSGTFRYYLNDAGTFTQQLGADNLLDGFNVGNYSYSYPAFVDLDGDGDLDLVAGDSYGNFRYYENSPAALPVELIAFTGVSAGASNLLTWATATEENNEGFQIERSADGRSWETIGFVAGAGTTPASQSYDYRDAQPLTGVNYYRLKQVDFDGAHEYSRVITIRRKAATTAPSFFPNPVTDHLTISNAQGQATLFNQLGQPVLDFTITDAVHTLHTSQLAKGHYVLRIVTASGEVITTAILK